MEARFLLFEPNKCVCFFRFIFLFLFLFFFNGMLASLYTIYPHRDFLLIWYDLYSNGQHKFKWIYSLRLMNRFYFPHRETNILYWYNICIAYVEILSVFAVMSLFRKCCDYASFLSNFVSFFTELIWFLSSASSDEHHILRFCCCIVFTVTLSL